MNIFRTPRARRPVLPEQHSLHFRTTELLLARRKRLRQIFSLFVIAFVGLGSLLMAAR